MRGIGPEFVARGASRCAGDDKNETASAEVVALHDGYASTMVVLIEKRTLIRDCLSRCISADFGAPVMSFPDVESLQASAGLTPALIIVSAWEGSEDTVDSAIQRLCRANFQAPIVILSDAEDIDNVSDTLRSGARGHVPTGTALEVAIEAMRLVLVGGVFVPGDVILTVQRQSQKAGLNQKVAFTARQNAVLAALCQGKANKLIAHELSMSESTVKVHVHNIMKKLRAKNRTEVAVKVGLPPEAEPTP